MFIKLKRYLRSLASPRLLDIYHSAAAVAANVLYSFPSRKLRVIGVTGTNGKTTTCHLISSIFEKAGYKTAMATTISFKIGKETVKNNQKMTTVSPFVLQKFLKKAVKKNCQVAVLEVTSHALVQRRVWGIKFHTAVFTNLTHDHLDYHKNFSNYLEAKKMLFAKRPTVSVINADSKYAKEMVILQTQNLLLYSIGTIDSKLPKSAVAERPSVVLARKIIPNPRETMFTAVTPKGQISIDNKLPGKFNISNSLAAVCVGLGSNIPLKKIKEGIEAVSAVRGRMEKINEGQPFNVIVDYAHTPDAFEKVFDAVAPLARKKIITVHGATGARDKTKRPILGAISARRSDVVIVTDEDPYHEDPLQIIKEVANGVKKGAPRNKPKILGKNFFIEKDRRRAIRLALTKAKPGDLVLILGKGAEEVMAVKDPRNNHGYRLIPWNERAIVREELKKIYARK